MDAGQERLSAELSGGVACSHHCNVATWRDAKEVSTC